MRYMPVRYAPMRHRPIKRILMICMPMRYTFKRYCQTAGAL
jgi:hypothetical protein